MGAVHTTCVMSCGGGGGGGGRPPTDGARIGELPKGRALAVLIC